MIHRQRRRSIDKEIEGKGTRELSSVHLPLHSSSWFLISRSIGQKSNDDDGGNVVSKYVSGCKRTSRETSSKLNVTLTSNTRNGGATGKRPARGFGRGQCRLDARYYYPDRLVFSSWPTNTLRKFSPYHRATVRR